MVKVFVLNPMTAYAPTSGEIFERSVRLQIQKEYLAAQGRKAKLLAVEDE